MKIKELLCTDAYWLQGYRTRIVADNSSGNTPISFSVFGKAKSGRYIIELYHGESEEKAVEAFIYGENLQ